MACRVWLRADRIRTRVLGSWFAMKIGGKVEGFGSMMVAMTCLLSSDV